MRVSALRIGPSHSGEAVSYTHLDVYKRQAIHRTIDIFGTGCGLVACKPWPLQFTPSVADDQEALKRLALPCLLYTSNMSRPATAHNRGLRVIPAQSYAAQRAFGGVVVDLDVAIF